MQEKTSGFIHLGQDDSTIYQALYLLPGNESPPCADQNSFLHERLIQPFEVRHLDHIGADAGGNKVIFRISVMYLIT